MTSNDISLSNGITLSFDDAVSHLPFLIGQLEFTSDDFDQIVEKVTLGMDDTVEGHVRFAPLISVLATRRSESVKKLISHFIEQHFRVDELTLGGILSPLSLLEQIRLPVGGENIIFSLIDAITEVDIINGQCAHAIMITVRRVTKAASLSPADREAVFNRIWSQIQRAKLPTIPTLLTLFDHYHVFYPSRKGADIYQIRAGRACLVDGRSID